MRAVMKGFKKLQLTIILLIVKTEHGKNSQ